MEQVICMHGHYYDGDKYKECPHCASGMKPVTPSVFAVARDTSRVEMGKSEEKTTDRLKKMLFGGRTGGKEKDMGQKSVGHSFRATEVITKSEPSENFYPATEIIMDQNNTVKSCQKTEYVRSDKTEERYDEECTIGFFSTDRNVDPPVGYLICIEGMDYGNGFPLKLGGNSIGRSVSMDVALTDPKVSREKQAYVLYDPYKREFFLKPENDAGLCYLNGEAALEPKALKSHDMIVIGDTKLMLIPVCDERFDW